MRNAEFCEPVQKGIIFCLVVILFKPFFYLERLSKSDFSLILCLVPGLPSLGGLCCYYCLFFFSHQLKLELRNEISSSTSN